MSKMIERQMSFGRLVLKLFGILNLIEQHDTTKCLGLTCKFEAPNFIANVIYIFYLKQDEQSMDQLLQLDSDVCKKYYNQISLAISLIIKKFKQAKSVVT